MSAMMVAAVCACTPPIARQCSVPPAGPDTVWVLSRGWHTEIGISADSITGGLTVFRGIYPGATVLLFGYGKRTFMTARADRFSEYVLGPFPGPAVIESVGLRTTPPLAYGTRGLVTLQLPPGGARRISAFIWHDLQRAVDGAPRLVGPGAFAGSQFYDAVSGYSLVHTCNTWVAEALRAGGLPISSEADVFSGQTMARAANLASAQCEAPTLPSTRQP
jgi:hypothetical protein